MGMDLYKFKIESGDIKALEIITMEDVEKAKRVLEGTKIPYKIVKETNLDALMLFVQQNITKEFNVDNAWDSNYNYKWCYDFRDKVDLEDGGVNYFVLLNEQYQKLAEDYDKKIDTLLEKDDIDNAKILEKERDDKIDNAINEAVKRLEKDRVIEFEYGTAYVFSDKEMEKYRNKEVIRIDYDFHNSEVGYCRKPFRWESTEPTRSEDGTVTLYVDNWTGVPKDKIEELKKEAYYNEDESQIIITSVTKKAQDLLIECTNPDDREYIKGLLPLKDNELISIDW